MPNVNPKRSVPRGFTLLEVMLVLLLMGLAAGYVMFNAFGASKSDLLKSQAQRLQVIVDMASDYAVLNQQQLGIRVEQAENSYYFVYLDDEDEWQRVEDEKMYAPYTLPEPFTLTLNLDDLPWDEEDSLFDRDLFDENLSVSDAGVDIGSEEEKTLPPPQILIMSSGEITPFSLMFNYEGDFNEEPVYFALQNKETPTLSLTGPLDSPE
ncbi:MAG: type II secretion system protein GspH [Alteromonas sp.]|uniref:type II secretion system minor pseudopilin GspH n=1 Tax=Alteromonas australica TaxID=589873 RepID=UPI0005CAD3EA|nr:type II secretion system minor pseudopilin GspH [Alteromonas australica]MAO29173.1 type II secretion system protein GspH [Alteromonas sp.]HBF70842.1 type II secretion system protein GspH [Alteromonas australica]